MTIAAAYLTSEGVVLGADSTTTVSRDDGAVLQLLNHAQKVFEIGDPGRLALCTWGSGMVGSLSHRTIAARVADYAISHNPTVASAADELIRIVQSEFETSGSFHRVGYFIGGRDPDRTPRCELLWMRSSREVDRASLRPGECRFAGNPDYFSRVCNGYSPDVPKLLKKLIRDKMADLPSSFEGAFDDALEEVSQALATEGFQDVPIREAIDYVHAFLHITIKAFKFRSGAPVCGGPIEVGFVTTDRDFRWAMHKPFSAAVAEQGVPDDR